MLLDVLLSKLDNKKGNESTLFIEDDLLSPKTNSTLKVFEKIFFVFFIKFLNLFYEIKIVFTLNLIRCYDKNDKFFMNSDKLKRLLNASISPVTPIDFVKTIKKTGEFVLKNFILEEKK